MHQDQNISQENEKSDMIDEYNVPKADVDTLDQLCANYSVARRTRRWQIVIFFSILNISAVNRLILMKYQALENQTKRRNYLV